MTKFMILDRDGVINEDEFEEWYIKTTEAMAYHEVQDENQRRIQAKLNNPNPDPNPNTNWTSAGSWPNLVTLTLALDLTHRPSLSSRIRK